MNTLKFTFSVTECNGWPKLKFFIDDDLIEDFEFTSESGGVSIPLDVMDGHHKLSIEIYGKTHSNTICDSDGNIIQDQLVEMTGMYIDDIKLPAVYMWMGVYHFNGIESPQSLIWGCNGLWVWDMEVPLISWILDKKIENHEKYSNPTLSHKEALIIEQEKISNFEYKLSKL
jgi:hypothetical protein